MPVTINGDGSITGLSVGGLGNSGIVDADSIAANAITNAKLASGAVSTSNLATNATYACARYIYRESGGGTTISSTGMGTQCPISDVITQKNITLDSGNSRWTHTTTGIYFLIVRYRQDTGGDIWSVFGVTKGGNSNCVGLSARTGSENSHNEAYNIIYTVDSTTATYQLQGWSGGSKTVKRPDGQGKPQWSNYDTLVGYSESNGGVMLDYNIFKIGDT